VSREAASTLIRKAVDLPTLPAVIPRLIEVVEDERSSAQDLARVIMTDQSLTARILKLANSAFYGQLRKVSSVTQAVVLLGFDLVKSLVLGLSVFDALWGEEAKGSFERAKLWRHSLASALASHLVATWVKVRERETAFVAGLLHDIGRVALHRLFPREYQVVGELQALERCPVQEAETLVLGFDHAEAGGWLCDHWKLPPLLVNAIAFHHRPGEAPSDSTLLTCIVHTGDLMAKDMEEGSDEGVLLIDPVARDTLQVTEAELLQGVQELGLRGNNLQVFLGW